MRVPPVTRNAEPVLPVSEPPAIVSVPPVTLVSEMPFVPALDVTLLRFPAPSAMPLSRSAVLPDEMLLVPPVNVSVPPALALTPRPVVVLTLRLPPLKLIVDPVLVVRTMASAAPVVKLLMPP